MSITTITIATVDYVSYASVAEADAYLAVDPVRGTKWGTLTVDEKGAKLVAATRRLDLLKWKGAKTGDDATQLNQWPRTGLVYPDGSNVSTTEVPDQIANATIILAGSIAINAAASTAGSSASNKKKVVAGPVQLEFFRPTAGKPLQDETAFELVAFFFLAGGSAVGVGGYASGCDQSSSFAADQMGYGLTEGYS